MDEFNIIIRSVVRGERPIEDLELTGISMNYREGVWYPESKHHIEYSVSLPDIATGILKYISDPEKFKKWSLVFEVCSDFIHPSEEAHSHPEVETVFDVLWKGAFKGKINEKTIALIKKIAKEDQESKRI